MSRMMYEIREIENGYILSYERSTAFSHVKVKYFAGTVIELASLVAEHVEMIELERNGTKQEDIVARDTSFDTLTNFDSE